MDLERISNAYVENCYKRMDGTFCEDEISLYRRVWLLMYVTDAMGCVNDYNVGQECEDGYVTFLAVPTTVYEAHKKE